jgi:Coenzyme PQQ synthesis protein D (PqqD)
MVQRCARWQTAAMPALRLRRERLEWRRVEGEVIAVDLEASTYLSANESAAPLWEELSRGTTREQLIERLTAEFGLERDRASADIDEFLSELAGRQLLDETGA